MTDNLPVPTSPPKFRGGRKKGSKNRSSFILRQAQIEIEKMYGVKNFDPVVFLMVTAANPQLDYELRIVAAAKSAPYVHSIMRQAPPEPEKKNEVVDVERLMQRVAKDLLIENHVPVMSKEFTKEGGVTEDEETSDDTNDAQYSEERRDVPSDVF